MDKIRNLPKGVQNLVFGIIFGTNIAGSPTLANAAGNRPDDTNLAQANRIAENILKNSGGIIASINSSGELNTYTESTIPESVISKAQKMQADKSIDFASTDMGGGKGIYVIRKANGEVTISYEGADYNEKYNKSAVTSNFDPSGGRISVKGDDNFTTTFRGRTGINAVPEKDSTKPETMADKLNISNSNISADDNQRIGPVSAGVNFESKDNYSFDIGIIQDINNIKNDTQLKGAYRVLYAAGRMGAYIGVEKGSEFEKFVISNDFKIEGGKVRVSASLLDKLMNVNVAEINKSFETKMKQKAVGVEYTKYLTEFNEKGEWINKANLLKEISTSINFFTAGNQNLGRIGAIVQETNAYFDQTGVYAGVAGGNTLVAESKFVWMLSENLRLDTTLGVDYNMQNSMYDQSANSKFTPVYGAEARYKLTENNTIYGGYKHMANGDEYKGGIETRITDEIKTFVEANRFNYNDSNFEASNGVMVGLRYTWGGDKSSKDLYTPTKPGDKLTLSELNPIASIDARNIRVKTRLIIYKEHEVFIDKTVFAAGDGIDKNEDGTLKDIYFDNGGFAVQSIDGVSDSRYSPFITIVSGKLAITNIVGLNNQMKAEGLTPGNIKNIRVSVHDTSGLSLYDINLVKGSVRLIATVERVFTVSDAQAQAFLAGTKTLAQIEAEIIAAQDHINPVATGETLATAFNTALNNIDVLANDTDNSGTVTLGTNITNQVGGTFTKNGNKINFTPTNNFSGAASATYEVKDIAGNTATAILIVNVAPQELPPAMGNVPDQAGVSGTAFNLAVAPYVTLTNGDAITTYTLTGALPTGVNFDTITGILSGTPTQTGTFPLSVTATDNDGASNSDAFNLVIAAAPDTTPDAITLVDQNNVALSTVITSAPITVQGISAATAISVAGGGGEYSIDGGAWTNVAGTVTNGQTIRVRHTSSGANSTATNTTLTIGGVSDVFTSTTEAAPVIDVAPVVAAPTVAKTDTTVTVTNHITDADGVQNITYYIYSDAATTILVNSNTNGAAFAGLTASTNYWVKTTAETRNGATETWTLQTSPTLAVTTDAPANVPPTANNFVYGVNIGNTAKTFDWKVLSAAADVNGDTLTATVQIQGTHGTFAITGDNITYTPAAGYVGSDIATIRISDGQGHTIDRTVTVNGIDTNLAPIINNLPNFGAGVTSGSTTAGKSVTFGDETAWGAGSTVSISANNGATIANIAPDTTSYGVKTFDFIAPVNPAGSGPLTVTITYTVTDANGVQTQEFQTVDVAEALNNNPVASDFSSADNGGNPSQVIDFSSHVSDGESADGLLELIVVSNPDNFIIDNSAWPLVTVTAPGGWGGDTTITYKVRDPGGLDSGVQTLSLINFSA